jgi:hypothetical protein
MAGREDESVIAGRAFFIAVLVAPITLWLTAPPMLQTDSAEDACAAAAEERQAEGGDLEWERLPAPHWSCTVGMEEVDLGWWAASP